MKTLGVAFAFAPALAGCPPMLPNPDSLPPIDVPPPEDGALDETADDVDQNPFDDVPSVCTNAGTHCNSNAECCTNYCALGMHTCS